jgi:simple sugar transport system permease protein
MRGPEVPAGRRLTFAWTSNADAVLYLTIVGLVGVMGIVSPGFLTLPTLFNVARESMVNGVFALGAMVVLIAGGIDVSFMAVGIFAGYSAVLLLPNGSSLALLLAGYMLAMVIGVGLGLVNAAAVAKLRLPTLIATLGTQTLFRGVLLEYVGRKYIDNLPPSLARLSSANLITVTTGSGAKASMHVLILPIVMLALALSWFLRRTLLGRTFYALGGNEESSRRMGLSVLPAKVLVFAVAGGLAGFAGLSQIVLSQQANPFGLVGQELDVLAAAVLGGAAIAGGRGSVRGVIGGVVLIALINSSLVSLGVPSSWFRAVVGLLLLIGVAVQSRKQRASGSLILVDDSV